MGEGLGKKVCGRRAVGEGPWEKGHWRRSNKEGSREKGRQRGSNGEDVPKKVRVPMVGKVVLISCEEKNNSLIFIP